MKRLIILIGIIAAISSSQSEPGFVYAVGTWPSQPGQIFVYDSTVYLMIGPTGMTVPGWYMTVYSTDLKTWKFLQTESYQISGYPNRPTNRVFTAGFPVKEMPVVFVRLLYSKERRTSPESLGVVPASQAGK